MKVLFRQFEGNVRTRTDQLASTGAYLLKQDIYRGAKHGGTRVVWNRWNGWGTGASQASIYHVNSRRVSNYDTARGEFVAKAGADYTGKPRTLDDLIFEEFVPSEQPGVIKSAFASLSLVVAFWEYGHHNTYTGQYESVPILSWTAFAMYQKMKTHYANIMTSSL